MLKNRTQDPPKAQCCLLCTTSLGYCIAWDGSLCQGLDFQGRRGGVLRLSGGTDVDRSARHWESLAEKQCRAKVQTTISQRRPVIQTPGTSR